MISDCQYRRIYINDQATKAKQLTGLTRRVKPKKHGVLQDQRYGPLAFVIGFPPVANTKKAKSPKLRFGIGEWYGFPLTALTAEQRRTFADIQSLPKAKRPSVRCPFQKDADCNKPGGVCSLRLYTKSLDTGEVRPAGGEDGQLRTVCPSRFEQDQLIYQWVAEVVLGFSEPLVLGEIGFLESPRSPEVEATLSDVGRIERVLALQC
jgi:Restriction endonuclease NotI